MNRPEPDSPAAKARSKAAAEWLVRRERGLTAAQQDEFMEWLAADPRHSAWLALHGQVMRDFAALSQWRPEHSEQPNPDLLAPPRRHRAFFPVFLAAAAVMALAAVGWWQLGAPAAAVGQKIGAAELERRILADGSSVDLNRGAIIDVAYTGTERRLVLRRGEALFSVVHDSTRPFIVQAADAAVRAVGTAFTVRLEPAGVEVLVTNGKVELTASSVLGETKSATAVAREKSHAVAGERAVLSAASAKWKIGAVTPEETARLLAWQPQLLEFASAPLERAIAEFNRRNRVQFILADPELASLPVVASIRSDRVEAFAAFLAAAPGVEIESRGDEIVVRRKR